MNFAYHRDLTGCCRGPRFCCYRFIEKDKEMQHTQKNLKYFEVDALQEWFQMYSGKQLAQLASHRVIMSYICQSVYSTW